MDITEVKNIWDVRIKERKASTEGGSDLILGMLFSIGIEAAQFYYGLGRCEVDDVIMNTLGCAIGTIPWFIVRSGLVEKCVELCQ